MLAFPNCKINLGLNVISKRSTGFHDIETVFYPISFNDILEVIQSDTLKFTSTGLSIDGDVSNNLCLKAYHLLKADLPVLPTLHIHLHKVIPLGAGLGGGSSNGAFMLKLLNDKFQLNIDEEQLSAYALKLGSDCPFFIRNNPCIATGRGEILNSIDIDLSHFKILLVNPNLHISTRDAFANLIPKHPNKTIATIIEQPINTWKNELHNDFETTIFTRYPSIKLIKEELYNSGAVYASMTGTGSTVYGIFKKEQEPEISLFKNYFHQWV